jgi:ribosomal protein L11 methyltransferase
MWTIGVENVGPKVLGRLMSESDSSTFCVLVRIGFEDPHCREMVISDLLQAAYLAGSDFSGLDMGEAAPSERVFDQADAPYERDLVDRHSVDRQIGDGLKFHFAHRESAAEFVESIRESAGVVPFPVIQQIPFQDWNQKWRENFLGVDIAPFWRVEPSWKKSEVSEFKDQRVIWMNPSLGFGTGEHATTQLCLEMVGDFRNLEAQRVLDFGTGSGILAIGAAKLGASVDAVEIDAMALESAQDCARMNAVDSRIRFDQKLSVFQGPYDLIVANILKNVLISYSSLLVERMKPGAHLILSGVLESDAAELLEHYKEKLGADCLISQKTHLGWCAFLLKR